MKIIHAALFASSLISVQSFAKPGDEFFDYCTAIAVGNAIDAFGNIPHVTEILVEGDLSGQEERLKYSITLDNAEDGAHVYNLVVDHKENLTAGTQTCKVKSIESEGRKEKVKQGKIGFLDRCTKVALKAAEVEFANYPHLYKLSLTKGDLSTEEKQNLEYSITFGNAEDGEHDLVVKVAANGGSCKVTSVKMD